MAERRMKSVPPDGGYGWVIASALALNSSIYIPLMQCFGLIFKDIFNDMNLSGAESSLIINLNGAFGMMMGLLNGVLLKMYGFRKGALVGAILFFSGVTLTSYATSFQQFIVFYGLIASLGAGVTKGANGLALNTYFKANRSKAMGFATTITGIGSILLPQLINLLLKFYDSRGVMLIIGGISAHFFATAFLLQPIEWHVKEVDVSPEEQIQEDGVQKPKVKKSVFANIVNIFDLDLLKDPIFINILFGMSLAIFSELNFTVLIPFILDDFGLNNDQTATFISTAAATDILFRVLAPYVADYLRKSPRFMYLTTLVVLILLRFAVIFLSNYYLILLVAAGLGAAKGIRKVFVDLIVPTHVSLEKLPSASGMEMMANGICILIGGALLGVVRDVTGSYATCIVIMNCVTLVTIVTWTIEWVVVGRRRKNVREREEDVPLRKV